MSASSSSKAVRRLAFQSLYQLDARLMDAGKDLGEADIAAVRELVVTPPPTPPGRYAVVSSDEDDAHADESADDAGLSTADRRRAFDLALAAFNARAAADAFMSELAPEWPAYRQAAVDRAILRLAHYEMTSGRTHAKIVVNEAVELAKEFSTEKSPAFINGLLDKLLKQVLGEATSESDTIA